MSDTDPFAGERRGPPLRGVLKETIRELNDHEQRKGADVDAVVTEAADRSEYTETDARDTLEQMLLDGEVYPPLEGRVKVTPQ